MNKNVQTSGMKVIRVGNVSVIPLDEQQMCLKDDNFVISVSRIILDFGFLTCYAGRGV